MVFFISKTTTTTTSKKEGSKNTTTPTKAGGGKDLDERYSLIVADEELVRFKSNFMGKDGKETECIERLDDLIELRTMYGLTEASLSSFPKTDSDSDVWEWASKTAIGAAQTKSTLIPGLVGGGDDDT